MNVRRAPWRRGAILVAALILAILVFGSLAAAAVAAICCADAKVWPNGFSHNTWAWCRAASATCGS